MSVGGRPDKQVTAHHLKDAARDPALAPRAEELLALAEALESADADALDPWADLDLAEHFARPESIAKPAADDRGTRFDATLDWVLGALVFLPLLFTWAGLWKATSAYEALVGADPEAASRPFLQLWQSGFQGHLDEVFRFGHVAVGGCLSLMMLFALTAVHGYRRTHAECREEQAQRHTRATLARLVPVLTRAQLCLNEHRFASPQRFAAELNSAAGRIQRMHTKAITTQEQLTRAAELVGRAMEEAGQRLAQAETYVRPLEDAAARFEETVRDSSTAIRTAVQDLDEPLSRAGDRLTDAVNGQSGVLDKALDELRATGDGMRDVLTRTTDRLETAVTGNSDSIRGALSDTAQRVEDSLTVLAASQRGFTTGIEVVADLNGRLINDLGTVAERTGEAAEASREAVLDIDARSRALHEAADRFASVADALERAVREAETARAGAETAQAEAEAARVRAEEALRRLEESRAESEPAR
ncbi:hypothetical protein SAMN05192584_11632 [Streptomyces pini]|uniref:Uncharacterized protein n=1 Tax=Streptomyces pini TaxID=1520580 RepID=A0A1I4GGX9_9ACTN|nr:hypothetical protein [Streptomyces pini]SFL28780.1 hypothetical protein SAMN05192584_11632 [Streptomyces pini]